MNELECRCEHCGDCPEFRMAHGYCGSCLRWCYDWPIDDGPEENDGKVDVFPGHLEV